MSPTFLASSVFRCEIGSALIVIALIWPWSHSLRFWH